MNGPEEPSLISALTRERDEARDAARYAFERWEWLIVGCASYQKEYEEELEKYPWIKELKDE